MKNTFFKHKFFSPKIWRRIARVVVVVLCLHLLLLAGLSIYISSSKERLISFLTGKMKETILGELKVDKADITVWQTFPKIGISLTNVSISDSFYHMPFLSAKQITAKFGLLDLVGSKLRIHTVQVRDAVFIRLLTPVVIQTAMFCARRISRGGKKVNRFSLKISSWLT
jgi:uncharacterized protein involved in outer membrane biogenesis